MGYMPNRYHALYPGGPEGPLRWQDDTSGVMTEAVHSFYGVQDCKPLTSERLELVREYSQYYINAPCWDTRAGPDLFARLREEIKHIATKEALIAWLGTALEVGIDPF